MKSRPLVESETAVSFFAVAEKQQERNVRHYERWSRDYR
jgi:hypothetical protein